MSLDRLLRKGVSGWRSIAGKDTAVERVLRTGYRKVVRDRVQERSGVNFTQATGPNFAIVRSKETADDQRVGIVLRGGCDLPSAFTAAPLIAENVYGTVCLFKQGTGGELGAHRTDQMIQTLTGVTADTTEVRERLNLEEHYFGARLFEEPDFEVDGHPKYGRFPKSVVVLSVGSDLVRVAYRHKTEGYLVDPGGFWLNNLNDNVLPDPEVARWFRQNFESVGRIDVADFQANLERIISEIRSRVDAHVVVYNSLVVDPGSRHHNYQLLASAHPLRRREFSLALTDLSAKLDFHIVDVDRILKIGGVQEQVDFAHFPVSRTAPIGAEFYRILRDLEVVR